MSKNNGSKPAGSEPLSDSSEETWLEYLLEPEPHPWYEEPPEPPPDEEQNDELTIEHQRAGITFRLRGFKHGAALGASSWLIDKILPATGASMLFAPSGIGKTWLGLDWSVRVAAGIPWLGKPLSRGSVIYIAAEGAFTVPRRTAAITQKLGIHEKLPLFTVSEAIIFNDEAAHVTILADALKAKLHDWDWPPAALVVVDTYTACVQGSVNDDDVAAAFMRGFRKFLRHLTGHGAPPPAGLVIHHPGLGDAERPRGSSAFPADLDCMMLLEEVSAVDDLGIPEEPPAEEGPPADRSFLLRCSKMRQGIPFPDVPLAMQHFVPLDDFGRPVEVGGETLTGLVVKRVSGQVLRRTRRDIKAAEQAEKRVADRKRALQVLRGANRGSFALGSEEWRQRAEITSRRGWDVLRDELVETGQVIVLPPDPGKKRPTYAIRPMGRNK